MVVHGGGMFFGAESGILPAMYPFAPLESHLGLRHSYVSYTSTPYLSYFKYLTI